LYRDGLTGDRYRIRRVPNMARYRERRHSQRENDAQFLHEVVFLL
jgi:hypothetical protein